MRLQTVKHFLEPVLEPLIRKVVRFVLVIYLTSNCFSYILLPPFKLYDVLKGLCSSKIIRCFKVLRLTLTLLETVHPIRLYRLFL